MLNDKNHPQPNDPAKIIYFCLGCMAILALLSLLIP